MTLPAQAADDENSSAPKGGTIFTAYRITQFFVVIACVVCVLLFRWGGKSLGIPAERGFDDSVLQQPHWPLVLISIYVIFAVCLVLGTLISGRWWFFGGLFSAAVGLAAMSALGGPMRYVLFDAQARGASQRIFITLAIETILLFIPIALAWSYFWKRFDVALPAPEEGKSPKPAQTPIGVAIVAQIAFTGAIILLLAATDAKKQVLMSAFLGGLIGAALADYAAPHRQALRWYWVGPLAVAVIGYLLAYINSTPTTNGLPQGAFAALARPLPLDYASLGAAGALLGYWAAADRPRVRFSMRAAGPTAAQQSPASPTTEQTRARVG